MIVEYRVKPKPEAETSIYVIAKAEVNTTGNKGPPALSVTLSAGPEV